MSLQVTGLTTIAATVLGGTSLIGLAFGFAFRDIAENFLAGVPLSVRRPFALGDTIEVDGPTGVVQSVTGHGVRLMDFDGNIIQLSNSTVYKGTIRNFTANPKTRQGFTVGVGYDSSIEDAQRVLLETIGAYEAVLKNPEPIVLATRLGSATVELTVYAWVDS